MQVKGLDHVNIIADDLDATAQFYEDLLGLRRGEVPVVRPGLRGAWLFDEADRAIIHLMRFNPERHAGLDRGSATGAIDHVALACEGFAAVRGRCEELGVAYKVSEPEGVTFRQIIVTDPNNVMLELNFAGG